LVALNTRLSIEKAHTKSFVSSAKGRESVLGTELRIFGRSFIHTGKSTGPKPDTWGNQQEIVFPSDTI
jgi:hypothetical protein